jgi:pyruvate dehydrogenase E2 component (dihydrolipoamide acetyltransferase)
VGSTLIDITSAASAGAVQAAAPAAPAKPAAPAHVVAAVSADSLIPFKLADIGEGIAEVELMKWFVKVTDSCFTSLAAPPLLPSHHPPRLLSCRRET